MVYFSAKIIKDAFEALKGNVENKLFGLLGIMRSIDTDFIVPNRTYRISDGELTAWLDDEFYLSDYNGNYGESVLYVKFSTQWFSYVRDKYIKNEISVFTIIVFLYKFKCFEEELSATELLALFCREYHISKEVLELWFNTNTRTLSFGDSQCFRSSCKAMFGIANNTISLEKPFSVSARAGELTRAPFFQTLYAGMDGIKCMLILRENIDDYYSIGTKERPILYSRKKSSSFLPYLTALRTKPFLLLAGISGTGKSRIVRKLAQATVTLELQKKYNKGYESKDFAEDRWTLHSPANFQLIQVKPNWHNSMDVVGYFSNIPEPHYVFTPFVEFVVRAWQNPKVPFFLCLDEMNLAPVEEYFAEFLSAIESRGFEKDDKGNKVYMTDPIVKPFKEYGMEVAGDMMRSLNDYLGENVEKKVEEHLLTRGLTLPANLMVIGTVNMDETTFSFSRKVLDRAMSIEMNEVDYDGFLQDTTDDGLRAIVADFGAEKSGEDVALNKLLVDRPIEAKEIKEELGEDAEIVIGYLKKVNRLLEGTPFKLGYRAANEALIYLLASYDFGQTDRMAALDRFTMMKILSRVEGDEAKLSLSTDSKADVERLTKAGVDANEATKYGDLNLLTAMRCLFTTTFGEKKEEESEEEKTEWLSVKKIDSMIAQLRRDHFVSYWN